MRDRRTALRSSPRCRLEVCEPRLQLSATAVFAADGFFSETIHADDTAQTTVDNAANTVVLELAAPLSSSFPVFSLGEVAQTVFSFTPGGEVQFLDLTDLGDAGDLSQGLTPVGEAPSIAVFELPQSDRPASIPPQVNSPINLINAGAIDGVFGSVGNEGATFNAPVEVEAAFTLLGFDGANASTTLADEPLSEALRTRTPEAESEVEGRVAADLFEIAQTANYAKQTARTGTTNADSLSIATALMPGADAYHVSSAVLLEGDQPQADAVAIEDQMSDDLRCLATRVLGELRGADRAGAAAQPAAEPSRPITVELIRAAASLLAPADEAAAMIPLPSLGSPIGRTHGIEAFDVFDAVLGDDLVVAKIDKEGAGTTSQVFFSAAVAVTAGLSVDRFRKNRSKAEHGVALSSAHAEDETVPAVVGRVL